jgi:hypothetical protein
MSTGKTVAELNAMVNKLFDIVDQLTPWQHDFINDMAEQVINHETFSEKQAEKIVMIYEQSENKL